MKEEQEFGVKEEELDESNVGVLRKRGRPRKDDYYQDQQSLEQDGEENEEVISVTDSEQLKNQLDQNSGHSCQKQNGKNQFQPSPTYWWNIHDPTTNINISMNSSH